MTFYGKAVHYFSVKHHFSIRNSSYHILDQITRHDQSYFVSNRNQKVMVLATEGLIYLCLLHSIILNTENELVGCICKMLVSFVMLIFVCGSYGTFGFIHGCNQTSSCGCSSVYRMPRILNGELSQKHSWRWMVSLRKMDSNKVNTYSNILKNSSSTHVNITIVKHELKGVLKYIKIEI